MADIITAIVSLAETIGLDKRKFEVLASIF